MESRTRPTRRSRSSGSLVVAPQWCRTPDTNRERIEKLASALAEQQGWQLQIVKRPQRAFKITGLTWRSWNAASLGSGCNRRLSKDYEYRVQTSETMIDIVAIRPMLNRLAKR
ncbi:hypothetical protein QFZ34_001513 [Phyllobacterium ifriqiyense]|uniref:Uncharacterized protein n=1 Tax=Phyllobacterium ifriqiyense TaxID=314238 RepID=A0ABU0S749_9HYPH|nr:hypothetical protein [Phyllobacterium ifriqiyense]MDQ0996336.1 hypothetical protein [Phyllobacterium ifriqiyense]